MYKRNKVVALLLSISLLLYVFIPFPIAFAGSDYVTVNKTVNPDSIFVDEEAEVVLSVQGSPPVNVIVPNDVILMIDKSFSMNPNHSPNNGEDKIQNAKDAAKGFVDLMDMSKHRAGVVDFSSLNVINSFDLTTDAASIKAHIDTIDADGGTATGDAIYKSMELLEAKREEAQPVIVLLTDGNATIPRDGPISAYDYAKQAAAAAKKQGIVFYTIALLNVDEDPDTSDPNLLLKEMATTAQHHHFVLGSIGLAEIYNRIVEEIGRASAYDVTLTDIVSPEFEIVPDSYIDNIPKPTVEGNQLTWNFQELKDEELTFTYRIRHKDGQQVGNLPVSSGSNINYLDYTDARVNQEIEAPSVTVKHYPPDIIDLSSDSSGVDGGDILTIYGEYFRPGLTVNFGDIEAVIDAFIDATEVRVVVPSGQQGDITITLTNDDGQFDTAAFNYFADPVINKIEPAAGLITGGTEVRIDGQYFMQDAQVKFGEQQAKSVIVSSDGTFITATTPEVPAPIVVDVHVINPDGTNIMAEKGFSYELPPGPEITLINPNEGEIGGGEIVFIDGTNFTADGTVYFGEKQGVNYYRVNNTKIRVASPPADAAGPVDVKVVNADGQSAVVQDGFLYKEPVLPPGTAPEITLIDPNEGEMAGGEIVFIEGINLTADGEVYFGDKKAGGYYRINATTIRVTTPAADAAGPVDVKVVNADSQSAVVKDGFLYKEPVLPPGTAPEITLIDPNEGEMAGGEIVFIEGINLTADGEVYFGDKKAGGYYRVNATTIRVTTPAADAAGPVDVKVVNADSQSAVVKDGFLYKEPVLPPGTAPEITLIDPNEGEMAGGEMVYIEGLNLTTSEAVYFDDKKAGGYYRVNDTRIRVVSPAADAAGPVDVKVVNADGQSAVVQDGFLYKEPVLPPGTAPEITLIDPNEGEMAGGEMVFIEGINLTGDGEVYFGDKKAGGYYRVNATTIRVTTPAADAAGPVDVKVVNADSQSAVVKDGFLYKEPVLPPGTAPEITLIDPNEGGMAGGEIVFIEGINLTGDGEVYFGDKKAGGYYQVNATTIRVTTPAADAAGPVDVKVVNADGQSAVLQDGFLYTEPPVLPAPQITLIDPNEGKIGGGEIVFIEGANFTTSGAVYFGEKQGVNYYRVTETRIRVTTPAVDTAGPVDVKMVSADGQYTVVQDGFLYTEGPVLPAPQITLITPNEGDINGGEMVYIEGANLTADGEVYFGDKKASGYYRVNATTVRVVSPAADAAGPVDVKVVNSDGQFTVVQDGFLYLEPPPPPAPQITLINPNEGEIGGGEIVFIEGDHLKAGVKVYFGGKEVSGYYRFNNKKIRVTTPAADAAGPVDVKVVNSDGEFTVVQDGFLYIEPPPPPAPQITSIKPNEGKVAGGEIVTIDGDHLKPGGEVYFGGKKAGGYYRVNNKRIRVTSPPADAPGPVDVKVVNADGQFTVLADGFTYRAVIPKITSVSPNEGEIGGKTIVIINGENFERNAKVYFGSKEATGFYRYNGTKVRVHSPAADAAGTVDVTFENPDGTSYTLKDGFTYKAAPPPPSPVVTSISPNTGSKNGNTFVLINGENFERSTKVYFGSEEATGFYYYNSRKIRVFSPAASAAGPVDVKVQNTSGQSVTVTGGFTYTD